jgi:hypothetical protein
MHCRPTVTAGDPAIPGLAVTTMPLDHDAMHTDHQSLRTAMKQNLSMVTNHRTAPGLAISWIKWTAGTSSDGWSASLVTTIPMDADWACNDGLYMAGV